MCAMISGLFIGINDRRPPQAYKENLVSLKTHFELHNPLMTLSSLEIRNSLCLIPVLQIGACGGVTEQNLE